MLFRESETVELKEVVVDDIKKEIIAFANCDGGKLYIGVRDAIKAVLCVRRKAHTEKRHSPQATPFPENISNTVLWGASNMAP